MSKQFIIVSWKEKGKESNKKRKQTKKAKIRENSESNEQMLVHWELIKD